MLKAPQAFWKKEWTSVWLNLGRCGLSRFLSYLACSYIDWNYRDGGNVTTYPEADIVAAINELLDSEGLTWDEFIALGRDDGLADINPDLDFAYRNLVPHLKDKPVPA
jgi:hypothetical protein